MKCQFTSITVINAAMILNQLYLEKKNPHVLHAGAKKSVNSCPHAVL